MPKPLLTPNLYSIPSLLPFPPYLNSPIKEAIESFSNRCKAIIKRFEGGGKKGKRISIKARKFGEAHIAAGKMSVTRTYTLHLEKAFAPVNSCVGVYKIWGGTGEI
mmetsp:Transcript_8029/g.15593  ORF Transcript_8029/g.15593 Transcript_8029/m.15593 type:complete len:106 (-) Transcript_8029:950-1267(-)